jgi:hypothetical protein
MSPSNFRFTPKADIRASKAVIAFAMEKYLYKPSTMNDRDFVAFMRIAVASFILSE